MTQSVTRAMIEEAARRIVEKERVLCAGGLDALSARLSAHDAVPAPDLIVVDKAGKEVARHVMDWNDWATACEQTESASQVIVRQSDPEDEEDDEDENKDEEEEEK